LTFGSRHEHDRPGRRVELLVVEGEDRATHEHDVDLLMSERLLGVLLDDLGPRVRRRVRVHSERADVEGSAHGTPEERPADDRDRLDLLEPHAPPPFRHGATLSPDRVAPWRAGA